MFCDTLGQEVSSESEPTTPRSVTPIEDIDRPSPTTKHHSIGTPDASESPSPPSTPRVPRPPVVVPSPPPPPVVEKKDASTMPWKEAPVDPGPAVVIPTPRPPSPPRPPKPRTPSPVSSTSSSTTTPSSSTHLSISTPNSTTDSQFSDHMWFDDRSEGQIDLLDYNRPRTQLIMKQAQRLLERRRQYASMTPIERSVVSPPYSPAGGTHTLSIGEVPPQYPMATSFPNQENGHTTPPGSDESNNSGKSEGEAVLNGTNGQQRTSVPIKYRKSSQGFLKKNNNGK